MTNPKTAAPLQGPMIAKAIESADWSNTPIGNKALLQTACAALRAAPAQSDAVSREALEAIAQLANVGWSDIISLQDALHDIHQHATAALAAHSNCDVQSKSEPVAWRWKYTSDPEMDWMVALQRPPVHSSVMSEPLYASPVPSADRGCDCQHPATTPGGFAAVSVDCPEHGDLGPTLSTLIPSTHRGGHRE